MSKKTTNFKSEIKGKDRKELVKLLSEKKNLLQDFRLGNARSKTKDVKAGRNVRKDIARIMTQIVASHKVNVASVSTKADATK